MKELVQIDFGNIFKISSEHGIVESEFQKSGDLIPDFLAKIKARDQGFYQILDDEKALDEIEDFAQKCEGKYDDIVVLGIGGSALGTITLRDAFSPLFGKTNPHLHVLENIDPDMISEILDPLDLSRTLFLAISKSGGTPETLSQYMFFRKAVEDAELKAQDHFVFITDPQDSLLLEIGKAENISLFFIPSNVGGRFSVLTSVGLLPTALIGIDIRALMEGAKNMRDQFSSENFEKNIPFQLATVQHLCGTKGKTQNVLMPYATKLRTFAGWFAQLLAESTGKINKEGVNVGLTPVPSLGATDQHSQLQLFAEGPNDKLVIFLRVNNFDSDPEIPVILENRKVDFLKGVKFSQLLNTEQKATADALTENNRPNCTIEISEISEEVLGQLFLLFEGATAFLGEYLQIDAFDQPGVERSKILTKEYLSGEKK